MSVRRTRIVQVTSSNAGDAPRMLTESQADEQAIIVMVKNGCYGCCCCEIKFDIPAGLTTLEEDCGKSKGIMRPGAHWCYCCNRRVACMVSKAIINYNAPVANCPTKDNAYISVDLYFNFRLPRGENEVKNFVYRLGAARFDELLYAEIDENIRTFINGIWLNQVFDLKGEMAKTMIQELNQKFSKFGIIFENCNVTKVHVSPQLTQALEEKTKIKYSLANHIKEIENKKLSVENSENQELSNLQKENERKMNELRSKIQRANVEREQDTMEANTQSEVSIVHAEERKNILTTQAEGEKKIAESQVKAQVIEVVNKAKAAANTKTKETDEKANVTSIEAESKLLATKAKYAALIKEAKSELAYLEGFEGQRKHNYQVVKAKIYEEMAKKNPNIVMSGDVGEALLQSLFELVKE